MVEILGRLHAVLADRCPIEDELSHGGMGSVYYAEDRKHQRGVTVEDLWGEVS